MAVKSGPLPTCLIFMCSRNKNLPISIILLLASLIQAATSPRASTIVQLSQPQLVRTDGMDFTAINGNELYIIGGGNITGIKHDPIYCM